MDLSRRGMMFGVVGAAVALSGCVANTFRTYYDKPLDHAVTRNWRVTSVTVNVPRSLTVSEAHSYEPDAQIVWREDPPGDRYAQVQKIIHDAVARGAAGLKGARPVRIEVTVSRFHALTFEAESLNMDNVGIHNVDFTAQITDARTGAVLVAPTFIDAAMPAMTGATMAQARAHGQSQKSQITAHVAATIAGWLGTGPDVRMSFNRIGR